MYTAFLLCITRLNKYQNTDPHRHYVDLYDNHMYTSSPLLGKPPGGGGRSTFIWTGGGGAAGGRKPDPVSEPLGAQNIHPVTIYLTQTSICIPCTSTDGLAILYVSPYIHTILLRASRARRHWHREDGPVINTVVPHAPSTRRWCRYRGPVINIVGWEPGGEQPCYKRSSPPVAS